MPQLTFSRVTQFVASLTGYALLAASVSAAEPAKIEPGKIEYNRDIRPILSDGCIRCHGPDPKERHADLRLDIREGATAKLADGGSAIVPGKLAESLLIQRILSTNPDEKMPPPATGRHLTPKQIETLKKWVEQGAEYQGHWSFLRPVKPTLPTVKHEKAVRNPIDRFIIAKLESEGLAPSPEADKNTLIRRVTFDLTGLPPTPAEVDQFLADTSADAYEKLVDRLLASPRYGEQMGRYWLDLARYGDTHGLHLDNERALWPYRDWVINSFNQNMPFNRFTIEQMAGDMLPTPTMDQRIATGFNRCNVTTSEGGSIDDEVRVRYAVDRTETMSTVFLGLTLGCAVCHDHKFDPLSQKEFYQLYAFFNASADAAMDGNALLPPPILKLSSAEDEKKLKEFDEKLAAAKKLIADELAKIDYKEPEAGTPTATNEPIEFVWIDDDLPKGAKAQGNTPWEFVSKPNPVHSGAKSSRRQAQGLSQHFFDGATATIKIGEGDKLFAHVYLDPASLPKSVMLQFNDGAWEHRAYWGEDVIPWGTAGSASRVHMGPLPEAGRWVRLEVEAAKVGLNPGAVLNGWAFTQHDGTCFWDKAGVVTRTPQDGKSFTSLVAWEAYEKEQKKSDVPNPVKDALKAELDKRNDAQKKTIRDYFLEYVHPETKKPFDKLHKDVTDLEKQKKDFDASIPASMVMADMATPRDTHILIRGQYDKKGDKVTAATPAILPPLPHGSKPNRLGLAEWLVAPEHPLTSRVTVNRFWQQYFGRGIVKTSEDFGAQGEWPSHPDLLDWLAVEFIEKAWDVKQLQKLIVTSATYRQSVKVTPALLQKDPENMLLARGPRFRLDAEIVRDQALFLGGLLVERIGGKAVKPYQPAGIWESVGFVGSNTKDFKRDNGDALYRRSLYTFWKRTAPPPSMMTFDAPSREVCVSRRARTNTPLQALVLMNDEQYVEAARHMAARILKEGGTKPEERLTYGFRLATARVPQPGELEVLMKLLGQNMSYFQGHKDDANKLLAVGETKLKEQFDPAELAAYTMIANALINLDETITKE